MLTTNADFLYGELMDVVRLFYGEDEPEISHFFVQSGYVFSNTVVTGGERVQFFRGTGMEWRDRIQAVCPPLREARAL